MKRSLIVFLLIFILLFAFGLERGYRYTRSPQFSALLTEVGLGVPVPVPLSGTGSMYPTFPKGTGKTYKELSEETVATPSMYLYPTGFRLFKERYFEQSLGHGDIVDFENEITKKITTERSGYAAGFVKRVIGIAGDLIELRNGIVYRNKEPLKEPYIARAQSTFGGEFLPECREIQVPQGSLFVMGDNRKGSNDSRHEIGFVKMTDVTHFIPFSKQAGLYDAHWHNATNDLDVGQRIKLNKSQFMKLLNDKRRSEKLTALKYNDKLENSARKRGEIMLSTDDFSFEATKSGYTMKKAMADAGYSNILWGELPIQGYYESDELFEQLYEFSNMQKFLLNADYDDFGIAEVQGNLNNCPAQVIVLQVAGYKPPNYDKDVIDSWRRALNSLREVAPGWKAAKDETEYYNRHKDDLDRMITLFDVRIANIEGIVARMESNQWLSESQEQYMNQDEGYAREQEQLAQRLNSNN